VFRIVVVARDERVETAGESVDWGVECRVVFIGEDNVEVAIELGCGELPKMLRDQREADEITLRAVAEDIFLHFLWQAHEIQSLPGRTFLCRSRSHGCATPREGMS